MRHVSHVENVLMRIPPPLQPLLMGYWSTIEPRAWVCAYLGPSIPGPRQEGSRQPEARKKLSLRRALSPVRELFQNVRLKSNQTLQGRRSKLTACI